MPVPTGACIRIRKNNIRSLFTYLENKCEHQTVSDTDDEKNGTFYKPTNMIDQIMSKNQHHQQQIQHHDDHHDDHDYSFKIARRLRQNQ